MTDQDIKTTSGETFSYHNSCLMAYLVYLRFGRDLDSATAAWNRLLQNNCTKDQFFGLVDEMSP